MPLTIMTPVSPDSLARSPVASARQVPDDFSVQSVDQALCETREVIHDADLPPELRSFLIQHGGRAAELHEFKNMNPCGWKKLTIDLNEILSYIDVPPEYAVRSPLQRAGSDDMDGLTLAPGVLVFCNYHSDGFHDAWYVSVPRPMTGRDEEPDPEATGMGHDFFVITTTTTDTPYKVNVSSPLHWEYFHREYLPLTQ